MSDCKNLIQAKQIDIESIIEEVLERIEITDPCFAFPYTRIDLGKFEPPVECFDEIDAGVFDPNADCKVETLDFGEFCP